MRVFVGVSYWCCSAWRRRACGSRRTDTASQSRVPRGTRAGECLGRFRLARGGAGSAGGDRPVCGHGEPRRARHRTADAPQSRLRMVHPGRRQPQRGRRGVLPEDRRRRVETGLAAVAPPRGADLCRIARGRGGAEHVCRQHPGPRTRYRVRSPVPHVRSRRRARTGRARRDRAHASRATTVRRRPRLPCLSSRLQGTEDRTVVRGADVRLQLLVRGDRLGDVGTTASEAGRHDSRARGYVSLQPVRVHEQRERQPHGPPRGDVLPHRGRHSRDADCDQGGRRWRGRLRRRWQLRALR